MRAAAPTRPVLVKLAPDLEPAVRDSLLDAAVGAGAAGVIGSNSTTGRDGLRSPAAVEAGGVSGRPLRERALEIAAELGVAAGDRVVIGSGGIGSGADARAMLDAGADLVPLWTGMIYAGPGLIGEAVAAC